MEVSEEIKYAYAKVKEIGLPKELSAGAPIDGYIVLYNAGSYYGTLGLIIRPEWWEEGKVIFGYSTVPPGYAVRWNIRGSSVGFYMPDKDAVVRVIAAVKGEGDIVIGGERWRKDDEKVWNIKLKEAPPSPPPSPPARKAKGKIIDVSYPETAAPQSKVEVTVKVKNVGGEAGEFKLTSDDRTLKTFDLDKGEVEGIRTRFTMGTKDARIEFKLYRREEGEWVEDDSRSIIIVLEIPVLWIGALVAGGLGTVYLMKKR